MNLVKWSEVSDIILLVINLPNFESKNVSIDEKSLHYHGISNGTEYQDTIHFLYEINTKKCSGKITENSLEFVIHKKIPCYWNSLTRTNTHLDNNWNTNNNDIDTIESNSLDEVSETDQVETNTIEDNHIIEENLDDINEINEVNEEEISLDNNEDEDNNKDEDNNDIIELDISNEISDIEELSDDDSEIDLNDNLEEVSFD